MTDRLVLGDSPLIGAVAECLADQPGGIRVGTTADGLATSLQESGIDVATYDTLDEKALRSLDRPEIVAVFEETATASLARCRAVRRVFPEVYLLASTGEDGTEHDGAIDRLADRVFDPVAVAASHVVDRSGENGHRSRQLWQILRGLDRLAIVTHDNPDPDAIASGIALERIAAAAGTEADVCYFGEITHQENRALVNVLNLELRDVSPDERFEEYDSIALVDHSRPGVNDQLPEETAVDIVIDHHPPRSPIDARFVDLRSDVGATSTLLVDYFDRFELDWETDVATALLFGIHVDTDGFSREISERDFEAASRLVPEVDFGTLERIETPNMSITTLETIAESISRRRVEGEILLSGVGQLHERDALAQAADRLLNLDGISTTLVYGVKDGTIYISARARGTEIDLGETLREAFNQIGSAGGHVDMAGAQIQLGVLEAVDDVNTSLYEIVDTVVASRFLDVLEEKTTYQVSGVYPTEAEVTAEYLAADETDPSRVHDLGEGTAASENRQRDDEGSESQQSDDGSAESQQGADGDAENR